MPITTADLEFRFSVPEASAGNQWAQVHPEKALGGYLSTTVWIGGVIHDLFQKLPGDDNFNLVVEYRCLFVVNKHLSLTWTDPVIWLPFITAGGSQVAIGVDPTAVAPLNSSSQQAVKVDTV